MPINLDPIQSGYNLSLINDNFQRIEDAWDEKLDRLVSAQGNQMEQELDANSNRIINHPNARIGDPNNTRDIVLVEDITKLGTFDGVIPTHDGYVGDGSRVSFALSSIVSDARAVQVYVGGLRQEPFADYTLVSNNIVFTTAPVSEAAVDLYAFNPIILENGAPIYAEPKHADFTGDGTTTTFGINAPGAGTLEAMCYIDGVKQNPNDDYESTNGVTTFTEAPPANSQIDITIWAPYSVNADNSIVTADGSTFGRDLSERFADTVNVKDYGATGDGVTDDTVVIQAAINRGGRIVFPPGTYMYSESIAVPSNCHISGANAILRATTSRAQLKMTTVHDVVIRDLEFDGNKDAYSYTSGDPFPIHISNGSTRILIENNTVHDAYRVGIYCGYGGVGTAPSNIRIQGNTIYNIGDATDPIAEFGNGIAVSAGSSIWVKNNQIYDIYGTGGINFEGVGHIFENIFVEDNYVRNITSATINPASARGIRMDAGSNPIFNGNRNHYIRNNIIDSTAGSGIYVKDMQDYTIEGNTVRNVGVYGIECLVEETGFCKVINNTVEIYDEYGIAVSRGEYVNIDGNTIFNSNAGSLAAIHYNRALTQKTLSISNNLCSNIEGDAIRMNAISFTVSDNVFERCGLGGGLNHIITTAPGAPALPANSFGIISGNSVFDSTACRAFINAEGEQFSNRVVVDTNALPQGMEFAYYGASTSAQLVGGIYFNSPDNDSPGSTATWQQGDIVYTHPTTLTARATHGFVCVQAGTPGIWWKLGTILP